MLLEMAQSVADNAQRLYEEQLSDSLESSDHGRFVCIEPESGEFFLGNTLDEAVNQAIDAYPGRLTRTIRVGHAAALHIGVLNP